MKNQQRGILDALLVPVILLSVLFIGVSAFAYWAYSSREDYKDNSDQKANAAVATAIQQTEANDAKAYFQKEKSPFDTFNGPSSFGSVVFQYPKTWSAYVPEQTQSNTPINGYFYPDLVPDVGATTNTYALRVELVERSYSQSLQQFTSNVTSGKLAATPYTPPKLPHVYGTKLVGQLQNNKQGTMVIVPLLNMTLEVWTESSQFTSDFTNTILPSLTFQQ